VPAAVKLPSDAVRFSAMYPCEWMRPPRIVQDDEHHLVLTILSGPTPGLIDVVKPQRSVRMSASMAKLFISHILSHAVDRLERESPSIAVLPFVNMSPDQENEFFAMALRRNY